MRRVRWQSGWPRWPIHGAGAGSVTPLIKAVAAENGLDVSAFLVMAGRKEAVRLARLAESFAEIDAAIAAAEAEAEELVWPPEDEVDEGEVARVQAEIAAARAESAARRRGAVA